MKCLKCGYENMEGLNNCSNCGEPLFINNNVNNNQPVANNPSPIVNVPTQPAPGPLTPPIVNNNPPINGDIPTYQPPTNNVEQNNKKKSPLGLIIIVIIIIGLVGFFVLKNPFSNKDTTNNNTKESTNNGETTDKEDKTTEDTTTEDTEKDNDNSTSKDSAFKTSFNNYNIETNIDVQADSIKLKQHSTGTIDVVHQVEYLKSTTSATGAMSSTITTESYMNLADGTTYTSNPSVKGSWIKGSQSTKAIDLKLILDRLTNMQNVEKVSNDHYRVQMTSEELNNILEQNGTNYANIDESLYIDVYVENGYITKLDYDFSKIMAGYEIKVFTITMKIYNYDKAGDVTIPQSVIDSAK